MMPLKVISLLIDAGLSGTTLKDILAAIDEYVIALREQSVTADAGCATPAAVRMRKMRERQRLLKEREALSDGVTLSNTVTEQPVTSDNILSLGKGFEEGSKEVVIARGRKKPDYPEDYEDFWEAYPTDRGMSKSEGFKAWKNLSEADRKLARSAIGAFKGWVVDQGPTYRVVHACRYLSQRRFEGFSSENVASTNSTQGFYVMSGTDQWDEWEAYLLKTKGRKPQRDFKGGWWFKSEFPPTQSEAA